MGFINAVLDEAVAYGFEGGPEYSTNETLLENGLRVTDSAWLFPRHRYHAQFDNLKDVDRDTIVRVIHAVRGKRHSFKFKDWNDYAVEDEALYVPPEYIGTTLPVQLYKTYPFGPAYTIRPIQAIEYAVIYQDGVPVDGTVDTETGMFYPAAAWVEGSYAWTGSFYVWVHFTSDYNSITINSWQANTVEIELEEDKREITAINIPLSWEE